MIHVSSDAAWRCIPGRSCYASSKIAMNSITEHVASESSNVRCVAVHPGDLQTSPAATLPGGVQTSPAQTSELGGATAVYLSTERATFLSGRLVVATWDMQELEDLRERVVEDDLLKTRVVGLA